MLYTHCICPGKTLSQSWLMHLLFICLPSAFPLPQTGLQQQDLFLPSFPQNPPISSLLPLPLKPLPPVRFDYKRIVLLYLYFASVL